MIRPVSLVVLLSALSSVTSAENVFLEAESFVPSSDGWKVTRNDQTWDASGGATLFGADGPVDATATKRVTVAAGHYRVWVRFLQTESYRGAFHLALLRDDREFAGKDFDLEPDKVTGNFHYRWDYVEADLPAGEIGLQLGKYKKENCVTYTRHVDCLLLTTDANLVPDHIDYGPQTWMRVTLGDCYDKPVQIHSFTYFAGHFHFSKAGTGTGTAPDPKYLLNNGESTPWCNITHMLFPSLNVGSRPIIDARYTYYDTAPRLKAKFEFATAPEDKAIVRTLDIDYQPGTLYLIMPTDLTTPENLAKFQTDKEIAEATGKIADAFKWPTIGRKPTKFPFFVTHAISEWGFNPDAKIAAREWKTLDNFGFVDRLMTHIGGGTWYMKNNSYCQPDIETMKSQAASVAADFKKHGKSVKDIVFSMIMDEPCGQEASFMATDPGYIEKFREWLKLMGRTPADLLVADWDAVKPVPDTERDKFPALHYFTQRFRTRALGDFIATQGKILQEAYGAKFPVLVNFSDGATYYANFYGQGVDYFELLDSPYQNAIWGECGGALASTYQCTSYNVDLMRAAARKYGQVIGHYLIDYGRTPWDSKCKAVSEAARGVKIFRNYFYGPTWANYEGGTAWNSGAWYAHPEKWYGNAELLREFGAAEDMLVPAKTVPAQVAIIYSSALDAWTLGRTYSYGYDRMHIWLALAHAQIPVDIVSEKQVEEGLLSGYKVCYLCGPNLTRAAADRLADWVKRGGTLYATAGAGSRDEYNRPMTTLEAIMPADRAEVKDIDPYQYYGRALWYYPVRDEAKVGDTTLEVLLSQQAMTPRPGNQVLATFKDGSPAMVIGKSGSGTVYSTGFLPGLSYARPAIVARRKAEADKAASKEGDTNPDLTLVDRSNNPWEFSGAIREVILRPVRSAGVKPPITCSVPVVDAVLMQCDKGLLIPLANYTLRPQSKVSFTVTTTRPVKRIESVHHGNLRYKLTGKTVSFSLPLESTDFVKLMY